MFRRLAHYLCTWGTNVSSVCGPVTDTKPVGEPLIPARKIAFSSYRPVSQSSRVCSPLRRPMTFAIDAWRKTKSVVSEWGTFIVLDSRTDRPISAAVSAPSYCSNRHGYLPKRMPRAFLKTSVCLYDLQILFSKLCRQERESDALIVLWLEFNHHYVLLLHAFISNLLIISCSVATQYSAVCKSRDSNLCKYVRWYTVFIRESKFKRTHTKNITFRGSFFNNTTTVSHEWNDISAKFQRLPRHLRLRPTRLSHSRHSSTLTNYRNESLNDVSYHCFPYSLQSMQIMLHRYCQLQ